MVFKSKRATLEETHRRRHHLSVSGTPSELLGREMNSAVTSVAHMALAVHWTLGHLEEAT